ncbi:hypothetical protein BGZ61DRAFT_89808 [Ilyonectria robusta]|uniref:uncharacterized protein n=1 Tax=Ilyonectria robusta TaxID=1079257 RepID=UPI001E8EADFE|nr:uncharacterized protein BGZ61DRAFT_89808 [Ilyonectria robusta]KAH8735978.1 hypothetical protein BGZ61DRAFT_89808 [Ilyonectria robusta]
MLNFGNEMLSSSTTVNILVLNHRHRPQTRPAIRTGARGWMHLGINKSCGARGRIHHHHHHLLRLHLQPQLDWFCHRPSARGTANTRLAGGHHLPRMCFPSMTIKNIFFVSPVSRTVYPDHPFIHDLPIVRQRRTVPMHPDLGNNGAASAPSDVTMDE